MSSDELTDSNDFEENNTIYYIDSSELLDEATKNVNKLRDYIYSNGLDMLYSNNAVDGMMDLLVM